jgi:hypothetical protein
MRLASSQSFLLTRSGPLGDTAEEQTGADGGVCKGRWWSALLQGLGGKGPRRKRPLTHTATWGGGVTGYDGMLLNSIWPAMARSA